jgi:hypothetical protein
MESRSISEAELQVVRWLLQHARTPAGEEYSSSGLECLQVVGGCGCGCASLDFEPFGQSSNAGIVADAIVRWPNGTQAGVMLWGKDGRITGLELYEMDFESAKRFPSVAELRTWEHATFPGP